jgi:predicted TIM-barrel fold metal-dependent hydrolase
MRNVLTDGGHDAHARLRDMDRDGVAGEVIYHGLNSGKVYPLPWGGIIGAATSDYENELIGLGRHLYNAWLVDFCSVEPERRAGLAQLPMWDPAAAADELEWAADRGLRGVNFPRLQAGVPRYNNPAWERLWSICEERSLPLSTHTQSDAPPTMNATRSVLDPSHPGSDIIAALEEREGPVTDILTGTRRGLRDMVFGGVFERHPELTMVITENVLLWWAMEMKEMDEAARAAGLPNLPSEYCARQLFVGATALSPYEVEDALAEGYATQLLWGSDYPHPEGVWHLPRYEDEPSYSKLSLRDSLHGLEPDLAAGIAGETAARIHGLDVDALRTVAGRIGALTFGELAEPVPDETLDWVRANLRKFSISLPFRVSQADRLGQAASMPVGSL